MTDADITALKADARGAAELRRAFNRAAEGFCAAGPLPPNHQHVWAAFYAAIVGSEAGLKAFGELRRDD